MAMVIFDSLALSLDFSNHAAFSPERDASSITTSQAALYNASIEFFLDFFNHHTITSSSQSLTDQGLVAGAGLFSRVSGALSAGHFGLALSLCFGAEIAADLQGMWHMLTSRSFYQFSDFSALFFADVALDTLYVDFSKALAAHLYAFAHAGTSLATYTTQVRWLFDMVYSADLFLIAVEVVVLLLVLGFSARVTNLFANTRVFYDDIVTFCKVNNISLTEVGVFFTFFLGFLIFDLFISAVDEDVTDVFSYFMFVFVVLLFFFLILGTDVQYYYMISSISNGDLTLRVIVFDVINNFLCILRIFFCWVRYLFYDLQVELVDFSFHYTDSVNDLNLLALYDGVNAGWFNSGFTATTGSSLFAVVKASGWILVYFYLDISLLILQMLIGFAKFFIAFFLLWLIVDLFILKAFVHSEAHYLHLRRAASAGR